LYCSRISLACSCVFVSSCKRSCLSMMSTSMVSCRRDNRWRECKYLCVYLCVCTSMVSCKRDNRWRECRNLGLIREVDMWMWCVGRMAYGCAGSQCPLFIVCVCVCVCVLSVFESSQRVEGSEIIIILRTDFIITLLWWVANVRTD
jgi:hypothetical protein